MKEVWLIILKWKWYSGIPDVKSCDDDIWNNYVAFDQMNLLHVIKYAAKVYVHLISMKKLV